MSKVRVKGVLKIEDGVLLLVGGSTFRGKDVCRKDVLKYFDDVSVVDVEDVLCQINACNDITTVVFGGFEWMDDLDSLLTLAQLLPSYGYKIVIQTGYELPEAELLIGKHSMLKYGNDVLIKQLDDAEKGSAEVDLDVLKSMFRELGRSILDATIGSAYHIVTGLDEPTVYHMRGDAKPNLEVVN